MDERETRRRGARDEPATVLLPTPPLADETAMTLSTPAMRRRCGRFGQLGGVPERGKPWRAVSQGLRAPAGARDVPAGSRGRAAAGPGTGGVV